MRCGCSACRGWEGSFADFPAHLAECGAARGFISVRHYRLATEAEKRQSPEYVAVDRLLMDMMGTSPALVHRIPAEELKRPDATWSTPMFKACDHLWSVRTGPLGNGAPGVRYFCLLAHDHSERLCCSIIFAKRPGKGFKERPVRDWSEEFAGQPWGPTVGPEELEDYKQVDGSVLFMIHAWGLKSTQSGPAHESHQGHSG
eukprot:gnl/TRDRNA2_/TRDRNA2_36923_c0_seq2.p1 gnl/TRDRNA2_/TRDRNA2_36923_c0~~gnl/TRDRNA2_/TRDRNA2_36923_c0_seq2.p1  ORF type:complete len:201 (-),score=28.37 gnl/TRDRNA2_/TRDRNA2_36923_c0_seq2:133-735(-)